MQLQLQNYQYILRESKAKAEEAECKAEYQKILLEAARKEIIKQGKHLSPV
jgi:uncharacterized protein YbcI